MSNEKRFKKIHKQKMISKNDLDFILSELSMNVYAESFSSVLDMREKVGLKR